VPVREDIVRVTSLPAVMGTVSCATVPSRSVTVPVGLPEVVLAT
jgi:hypothetical protein